MAVKKSKSHFDLLEGRHHVFEYNDEIPPKEIIALFIIANLNMFNHVY